MASSRPLDFVREEDLPIDDEGETDEEEEGEEEQEEEFFEEEALHSIDDDGFLPPLQDFFPEENDPLAQHDNPDNEPRDDNMAFEGEVTPLEPRTAHARPGTVIYYKNRLHQKIHEHSDMTVIEWIASWVRSRMTCSESHVESFYSIAVDALPANHCCPPSWRMCKDVLGVEDFHKHVYHFCSCSLTQYDPIPVEDYHKHVDDACAQCNLSRFETDFNGRLQPRSWCFYHKPQDLHVEMTHIYQKFRHHTCEAAGVYSILFFSASAGQICSNGAGVWYFHKDSNV